MQKSVNCVINKLSAFKMCEPLNLKNVEDAT